VLRDESPEYHVEPLIAVLIFKTLFDRRKDRADQCAHETPAGAKFCKECGRL